MNVPKEDRLETKELLSSIKEVYNADSAVDLKTLFVPEHLLCVISGDIMHDPVTLESGSTYERSSIISYFET